MVAGVENYYSIHAVDSLHISEDDIDKDSVLRCYGCGLFTQAMRNELDYVICDACSSTMLVMDYRLAYRIKSIVLRILKRSLDISDELLNMLSRIQVKLTTNIASHTSREFSPNILNGECWCDEEYSSCSMSRCVYLYGPKNAKEGDTRPTKIWAECIEVQEGLPFYTCMNLIAHSLSHAYLTARKAGVQQVSGSRSKLLDYLLDSNTKKISILSTQEYVIVEEDFCTILASFVIYQFLGDKAYSIAGRYDRLEAISNHITCDLMLNLHNLLKFLLLEESKGGAISAEAAFQYLKAAADRLTILKLIWDD